MQPGPAQQPSPDPGNTGKNSGVGCWVLFALSIPAQLLAYSWVDVYMSGYESWRDSLWCVTLYLAAGMWLAAFTTVRALPSARMQDAQRPVCVFVIARLFTISGVILLPIALGLADHRHLKPTEALYFIPLMSALVAVLVGSALMRMWRWARVGAMLSITAVVCGGGLVARSWFQMTATTPGDWLLLPFDLSRLTGGILLLCYLLVALPLGIAAVWCLTRRYVIDAFAREGE